MPLDIQQFKDVMARWASGVTVVTTLHEGKYKGTTASSFTSASLEPPLVMVCLAQSLYTETLVRAAGIFAVNILSNEQQLIGEIFAGMHPEIANRFDGYTIQQAATGAPLLPDTLGWLDCETEQIHTVGDHTLFIGRVVAADLMQTASTPLLYHQRTWGEFTPFPRKEKSETS